MFKTMEVQVIAVTHSLNEQRLLLQILFHVKLLYSTYYIRYINAIVIYAYSIYTGIVLKRFYKFVEANRFSDLIAHSFERFRTGLTPSEFPRPTFCILNIQITKISTNFTLTKISWKIKFNTSIDIV